MCVHCGAARLGRAFICIKCERPWQSTSANENVEAQGAEPGLSPSPPSPQLRRCYRIPTRASAPVSAAGATGAQAATAEEPCAHAPAAVAAESLAPSSAQRQVPPWEGAREVNKPEQAQPEACQFCSGRCSCLQKMLPPPTAPPIDESVSNSEDVPLLVDETMRAFYVRGGPAPPAESPPSYNPFDDEPVASPTALQQDDAATVPNLIRQTSPLMQRQANEDATHVFREWSPDRQTAANAVRRMIDYGKYWNALHTLCTQTTAVISCITLTCYRGRPLYRPWIFLWTI